MNNENDLQVADQEHATAEPDTPRVSELDAARLGKPKALFWNRPIVSDWTFWFAIVLTTLGGGQSIYRTAQGYAGSSSAYSLSVGLGDIFFTAVLGPLMLAVVPALVRFLIRRAALKRKLAALPEDRVAGWKTDPVNTSHLRWWSESGWTQATHPPKSRKIGLAGMLVYGAMVLVIVGAFFSGYSSSTSSTQGQSFVGQSRSEPNPNASLAADVYFTDLMTSIDTFLAVEVDPEDLAGTFTRAGVAFEEVESNFELMNLLVENTTDPVEIGLNSEQFAAMEDYMAALESWVGVRANFYGELETCGMPTSGMVGACEGDAIDRYESALTDTTFPVVDTYEAFQATLQP